jgi:hypothetical protein
VTFTLPRKPLASRESSPARSVARIRLQRTLNFPMDIPLRDVLSPDETLSHLLVVNLGHFAVFALDLRGDFLIWRAPAARLLG